MAAGTFIKPCCVTSEEKHLLLEHWKRGDEFSRQEEMLTKKKEMLKVTLKTWERSIRRKESEEHFGLRNMHEQSRETMNCQAKRLTWLTSVSFMVPSSVPGCVWIPDGAQYAE